MTTATFYSGTRNASSWAMRAWLALKEAGFPFEEVEIDIRRPVRFIQLDEMIAPISPARSVPVLDLGDTVIFDSLAIGEFANDWCQGRLLPRELENRARARSYMAWQHAGLSGLCARFSFESAFFPHKRTPTEGEQREAERIFGTIESDLSHGSDFLFGDYSLADITLVPTIVRLSSHDFDLSAFPASRRWMKNVLDNGFVKEWLEDAQSRYHIWQDDYLLPDDPKGTAVTDNRG